MTLDQLALKHQTDKASNVHGYTKWYERHFEPLRNEPITLFEASWGGYEYPDRGGQGAKTWREYFPNATIVSIDFYPKVNIPDGIHFYQGSQDDIGFWLEVMEKHGPPHIFIDDASHINPKTIKTFQEMFTHLRSGGWWVTEDLESSFWEEPASDGVEYFGCSDPYNMTAATALNLFRKLCGDVNQKHFIGPYITNPIESIHFYENIVFLKKR